MKRQQLTHWQHGERVVLVELDGSNPTISRKQDDVEEALALPVTRALLLALREACEQGLRGLR